MATRRILVVHPGSELYGSDRVLIETVTGIVEHGNDVTVVLPLEGPLVEALESVGARVTVLPAFVLRKRLLRPRGWGEFARSAWRGWRSAHRLLKAQRPELVFVNTVTLPLWPVLARLHRLPSILHVHEAEASASRLLRRVLYLPALTADRILVNSDFSLRVMTAAWRHLDRRASVVPNAVPGPEAVVPPRQRLDRGLHVLFIGRLSPRKGPDLVVDAIRQMRDSGIEASLDIVGSTFEGYEWYETQLRDSIRDLDLEAAVRLHGFEPDVWSRLATCDVLVVPSRVDEPFGNTAVEGVLAGRPVVVSRTSGLVEATADIHSSIHVEPDSAEAIAQGLGTVVDEWSTLTEHTDTSRQVVAERHSPQRYRERVAGEVDKLAGASALPNKHKALFTRLWA